MTRPLHPFIMPRDAALASWQPIEPFGERGACGIRLASAGPGRLFAAATGKLSLYAPSDAWTGDAAVDVPGDPADMPASVDLFLHISPFSVWDLLFTRDVSKSLAGFVYRNVETASLLETVGDSLRTSVWPAPRWTAEEQMRTFLRGNVMLPMQGGRPFGRAAAGPTGRRELGFAAVTMQGAADPYVVYDTRRAMVEGGDAVVNELLAVLPGPNLPILADGLSFADVLRLAGERIYPATTLEALRIQRGLSRLELRQIGDAQKGIYRERLLKRSGHAPMASLQPEFAFSDCDASNLFQLEAVVEFFRNYDDPWKRNAVPKAPADGGYRKIDWLDPAGETARVNGNRVTIEDSDLGFLEDLGKSWLQGLSATIAGNVVRLDGINAEHSEIISPGNDFIYLQHDTTPGRGGVFRITAAAATTLTLDGNPQAAGNRSSWQILTADVLQYLSLGGDARPGTFYRLVAIDDITKTLVVDRPPAIGGDHSRWRLHRSPIVVVIDSFGGGRLVSEKSQNTFRLEGTSARSAGGNGTVIKLEDAVHLKRVNAHFDTVYLAGATTASRVFRIIAVDDGAKTITVDRPTGLGGGAGAWTIPAGVGGRIRQNEYPLQAAVINPRRYDAYDGAVFVVHSIPGMGSGADPGPLVEGPWPITSYSSRGAEARTLSSARGNRMYALRSRTSGTAFLNFALAVTDPDHRRKVREARFYFAPTAVTDAQGQVHIGVEPDDGTQDGEPGKTDVLFHHGNQTASSFGTGSAGCLVHFSGFLDLRYKLAQAALDFLPSGEEPTLEAIRDRMTLDASKLLYTQHPELHPRWADKVRGTFWLIRPDELPLRGEA